MPVLHRELIDAKRWCAIASRPEEKVLLRYLGDGLRMLVSVHRPPADGQILMASAKGIASAVQGAGHNLRRLREGVLHLFDVKECFPSLDPFAALDVVDRWSHSPSHITRILRVIYAAAHGAGVPGISQGLSPSSVLADVGLDALDRALARVGLVVRYCDNYAVASQLAPDEFRARASAAATKAGLTLHQWQQSTFRYKNNRPQIDSILRWLGVEIFDDQVDLAPERWEEITDSYRRLHAAEPDSAERYLLGIQGQYSSVLSGGEARVRAALHSIRRSDPRPRRSDAGSSIPLVHPLVDPSLSPSRNDLHAERQQVDQPSIQEARPADRARLGAVVAPGPGGQGRTLRQREHWRPSAPLSDEMRRDAYEPAIERAMNLLHTESESHALAAICMDFLATNDFRRPDDLANLTRYLERLEAALGVRIIALHSNTRAILYGNESLEWAAA